MDGRAEREGRRFRLRLAVAVLVLVIAALCAVYSYLWASAQAVWVPPPGTEGPMEGYAPRNAEQTAEDCQGDNPLLFVLGAV